MARINPARVTNRAVVLRYVGIVIWGTVEGKILLEIINPAKILPIRRRMMGLISRELFSLIVIRDENRGFPSRAKKIMREL